MSEGEAIMLDMNRFTTREEWINYAKEGLPEGYSSVGRTLISTPLKTKHSHLLYLAFISRGRGLHEGIVDQIEKNNPHSVFPLIRTYIELISYLIYCTQNPHYIDVMLQVGTNKGRAKKGITAIQDAIVKTAPGLKKVYDTLSRYTHFNETGIYNTLSFSDEAQTKISWTEYPRWKNENDFKIACSQIHELAEAFVPYMHEFAEKCLLEMSDPS